LINNSLIIQTWRAQEWDKSDPDSIFIIQLEQKGKNTTLHAIHAGVRINLQMALTKVGIIIIGNHGKQYLAGKPISKHPSM